MITQRFGHICSLKNIVIPQGNLGPLFPKDMVAFWGQHVPGGTTMFLGEQMCQKPCEIKKISYKI
jgi:hypothetical protein